MVILTKITRIKQPLYTLAAFSSLTGGSKIGDYLRGLGVLRGLGLREAFEMSSLSKELRYLFTSILNITMIPLLFPQLQKYDHARLKMIMSSYKKYQSLALEMSTQTWARAPIKRSLLVLLSTVNLLQE